VHAQYTSQYVMMG